MDDDERWQWHAYVYGMRRVMLNCRDATSPVDPLGEWFNADLADAAEAFYRGRSA